ncbi:Ig-like domain-containing protein [Reichenbachiella carrageenanivorans]|uniref:Ig-like domain-containing protein n=1 Tax=Reichenbachiella carrageenanivorans TaxID=2979869 RepID=A0ABY6D554_9BACT|nr:Ig-like domain-containing protein [Reichenbachiella carrageenanivorans]UXX78980.1 Ig-like domain-containing protein [Reichenbachiella carrageenanivorans]
MKAIKYYLLSLSLLMAAVVQAEPGDTLQLRSGTALGASWGANGGYTTFGVAGQYVKGASIAGGNYTGTIGYLFGGLQMPTPNEAPIAISPSVQFYHEIGEVLTLDGYDPEGAPVTFEVIREPEYGTLSLADGVTTHELILTPIPGLLPDVVYEDTLTFQVSEVNTSETSNVATVAFKFLLEDTPHGVTSLAKASNTFTVSIADTVFNASYGVDVNYYNLSNPLAPQFVNIQQGSIEASQWTIDGLSASYAFSVDQTANEYLFTEDQVLVTVLVTSPNGYSSFNSYIIDNAAGGRVLASADGDYFVIGSEMTVPENKSVIVKLVAVDFAGFGTMPTVEWTKNSSKGVLSEVKLVESSGNIKIWEAKYTSTSDVGGTDDFAFRVFNPVRNSYESGGITMQIQEVNDVPKLAGIPAQQLNEGTSKDVTLSYSDPDNEIKLSAESLNPGLGASIEGGKLRLTALDDFNGNAVVKVWVEELETSEKYLILKQLQVTVSPVNDQPVLAAIGDQSVDEDESIDIALSATDVDSDFQIFSYQGTISDPALASLQFVGNTLKVIPKPNAYGTAEVSVIADDGSGASNALSNPVIFNVTFDAVNDEPVFIKTMPSQTLVENGVAYKINMGDYVFDAETDYSLLTYSTDVSDKITVSFTNGVATVMPIADQWGFSSIKFYIEDPAGNQIAQSVFFNVRPAASDIEVDQGMADIVLDEDFGTYTVDITSAFKVADGTSYIDRDDIGGSALGNTLFDITFDNVNHTMTLHSKPNVYGNEDFVLVGTTTGPGVLQTINVDIASVNDAPVISPIASQQVKEDGVLSHLVIEVSDAEQETLSGFAVTSANQSLVADANIQWEDKGTYYLVSIAPEADRNGAVSLTASVSDGTNTSDLSFNLNITAVNDLPELVGSLSDLDQEEDYSVDLATLFSDKEGDALTYVVEQKPDWITVSGTVLTGKPTNSDVGSGQITVKVSDLGGAISTTFDFDIVNINDAPIRVQKAGRRIIYAGSAFSYDFPASNFMDIDQADVLSYSVEVLPDWMTEVDGTVSGTPDEAHVGLSKVVYKSTDVGGSFARDTLYLDVQTLSYDVAVTLTQTSGCEGGSSSVVASGAFDYNWYDASDQLLQAGGSTFEATTATTVFVEGVDGQDIATASKFETSVVFNPLPSADLTQEGDELKVTEVAGYSYTWYEGDTEISGATGATYEPTESGTYKVTVQSDLGCSTTSSTLDVEVSILGLGDELAEVRIYPVPARDELTIGLPSVWTAGQLSIVNLQGQEMISLINQMDREIKVDLRSLRSGIYFVRMQLETQTLQLKFIKE